MYGPRSSQKQHLVHEMLHKSGKAKTKVAKAARKVSTKRKKRGG